MRGTRPYRHVCLPPLVRARLACSYCMRSQPRVALPNRLTHAAGSFITRRPCGRSWTVRTHPSVFYRPAGANVSDVQVGIHVDLCHSPSTSAGSAQGRRSTGSVPTRGQPGLQSQVEAVHESHQHLGSLARQVLCSQVRRVCLGGDLLHSELPAAHPPPEATSAESRCASLCPTLFCLLLTMPALESMCSRIVTSLPKSLANA